jgi:hypothetical protein
MGWGWKGGGGGGRGETPLKYAVTMIFFADWGPTFRFISLKGTVS